jgi:hypothetical protein
MADADQQRTTNEEPVLRAFPARALIPGSAAGPLLHADVGLSFWGGIDPATGRVIDRHHPLAGACVSGAILAIPSGRGSCTASGVLIEALCQGTAPAAIVLCEDETILPLGALVALEVFGRSLPVMRVAPPVFRALAAYRHASVTEDAIMVAARPFAAADADPRPAAPAACAPRVDAVVALSATDRAMLDGAEGEARALAMRILLRMATLSGAPDLIDVSRAHLDCCIYTGDSSVRLAEHMAALGARVRVPTTLNAISADLRPGAVATAGPDIVAASARQAAAFRAMGASDSFTCAPYLLGAAPGPGEDIGWAESNAVMFANSVLGARTEKYPDYLDLCIALTGRAPRSGCHLAVNRVAATIIAVDPPSDADDALWPLLGHVLGERSPHAIPAVTGLDALAPTRDDLKAFCAAFATTSAAPMVHLVGITPEAPDLAAATAGRIGLPTARIGIGELREAWQALNAGPADIGLVALGNPHFSATEILHLATLVAGRRKHPDVHVVIATARAILAETPVVAAIEALAGFGVRFVTDTCWCMLGEPVVRVDGRAVMTNSGKYAHYGPGLTGAGFRFGSLADCVDAACVARWPEVMPPWLRSQ